MAADDLGAILEADRWAREYASSRLNGNRRKPLSSMSRQDECEDLPRLVATLGGLGLVPLAPGTVASLVAVVAYFLLYQINPYVPLWFLIFPDTHRHMGFRQV